MLKKIRNYLICMIIGGLIFGVLPVFAEEILNIVPNSFPIYLNEVKQNVSGYNIDGSIYLKLRDMANLLGCGIDFTPQKEIKITSNISNTNNVGGANIMSEIIPTPLDYILTTYNGYEAIEYNGKIYTGIKTINIIYNTTNGQLIQTLDRKNIGYKFFNDNEELYIDFTNETQALVRNSRTYVETSIIENFFASEVTPTPILIPTPKPTPITTIKQDDKTYYSIDKIRELYNLTCIQTSQFFDNTGYIIFDDKKMDINFSDETKVIIRNEIMYIESTFAENSIIIN